LARVEARAPVVVCGLTVAEAIFTSVEPKLEVRRLCGEGETLRAAGALLEVSGPWRGILAAERTALNFLARLCGIASFTRRYVEAVAGTGACIVDTRKTVPGWRALDKYATAVGGAVNHRAGLYDGILLKDNHVAAGGGVAAVVKAAREGAPAQLRVQVEVESEREAAAAVEAGADALLLDNCSLAELARIAARLRDRVLLEASGGITLETVRAVAETGVHRISIGALTHSVAAADVALEVRDETMSQAAKSTRDGA
jgi:nicotinate-nucleotide pyrophosphorylase (carboxylating)